jgi:hypothetical protein
MSEMPPWPLIIVWIVLVPLSIRQLVKGSKIWKPFYRDYAEEHPADPTVQGWYAQSELQALIGLAIAGLATLIWLCS